MACTPEHQNLLTEFARGELGGPEADALLAHVFQCPECSQELDLLADLTRTLSRESTETARQEKVVFSLRPRGRLLLSAAALLVIAVGSWAYLRDGRNGNDDQLAKLAQIQPLPFLSGQLRSPDANRQSRFLKAMETYSDEDFSRAAAQLRDLLGEDPQDDKLRIYLGICHLQLQQTGEAIEALEPAVSSADDLIAERALWYLGMAHLLRADSRAAFETFRSLRERDGNYSLNAADMLDELEKLGTP